MNQRTQAIARENDSIDRNIAAIEAQKPPRASAIQAMANRLNITPSNLQRTLLDTVFKNASESEFAALIVVANEYGLNPLTKEIYAFPAKGGGIVPLVSIDGWIRICNQHPQYDGSEQNFVYEGGKLFAVETTIYRKDRKHPIKKMEFLSECKRGTDPWKMEHRMLGHKGFIQAARYAFGFSGIYDADDGEVIIDYVPQQQASVPSSRQLQQQQAQQESAPPVEQESYDQDTGEVYDEEEADAAAEREAARLNGDFETSDVDDDEPDTGNDVTAALDEPRWKQHYRETLEDVLAGKSLADLKKAEAKFDNHRVTYTDEAIASMEREIKSARKRLG